MAPAGSAPDAFNGVIIGLLSSLGSAVLIGLIFVLIYFFKYTSSGRIFLDRIGRPGEYDDEQAFAKEEEEALENMDDMQRSEYLRAKGIPHTRRYHRLVKTLTQEQHSSPPTLPSLCKPTYHCPSTWPSRRRASQPGSLSPSSRSPIASSRLAQK